MTITELIKSLEAIKKQAGHNDLDVEAVEVDIAIVTGDGWVHGYDCYITLYDGTATIYGDDEKEAD